MELVIRCGSVRLYQGDFLKWPIRSRFDLVLTDPPYDLESDRIKSAFRRISASMGPKGSVYLFGDLDTLAESWFRECEFPNKTGNRNRNRP